MIEICSEYLVNEMFLSVQQDFPPQKAAMPHKKEAKKMAHHPCKNIQDRSMAHQICLGDWEIKTSNTATPTNQQSNPSNSPCTSSMRSNLRGINAEDLLDLRKLRAWGWAPSCHRAGTRGGNGHWSSGLLLSVFEIALGTWSRYLFCFWGCLKIRMFFRMNLVLQKH